MAFILDTHALVWFLERNNKLGANARKAMSNNRFKLIVPTIVLTEIAHIYGKGRINTSVADVLDMVANVKNCTIYPLDEAVVEHLPVELDIHDGIIVATALLYQKLLGKKISVITKDRKITESKIVKTLW